MPRILVADDEEAIRRLIKFTLEELGHEVFEARDGTEAVESIANDQPELVILDVMMPTLDGWGVLREMRASGHKRTTRVILLTAKSSERDFVTGWKLGVDEYITKPFEPDELALSVNEILIMSPDQIQRRRLAELEKANLLSRIETAFGEG